MGMSGLNTGNGNRDPEGWWMMVMDTWAIPPFLSFEIRFCLSAPLFFFIHTILILGGAVFFSLSFPCLYHHHRYHFHQVVVSTGY
jgi:hypothetical protein